MEKLLAKIEATQTERAAKQAEYESTITRKAELTAQCEQLQSVEPVDNAAVKKAQNEINSLAKAETKLVTAIQKLNAKLEKDQAAYNTKKAKADAKAEKEALKLQKAAQKEANQMPTQNGVKRPKPETLCGKAWALMDKVSEEQGAPAAIALVLPLAREQGLNEGNVKTEYARWRKFNGVTGTIRAPKAEQATENTEQGTTPA